MVMLLYTMDTANVLGPVVQSIVSLTCSVMTNWLTVVAKVFTNVLMFCCKNVNSFCKATHTFSAKILMYLPYFKIEILT